MDQMVIVRVPAADVNELSRLGAEVGGEKEVGYVHPFGR